MAIKAGATPWKVGASTGRSALVPAAARPATVLTAQEAALNATSIEAFVQAIGGRKALVDVLSIAEAAPEIDRIVTMLADPASQALSLRQICTAAGYTVADFFLAYRKAAIARAHIQACHIIAASIPALVRDVMERAVPQPIQCPACAGASQIVGRCPKCQGRGRVMTEPTVHQQKLALQLAQFTERGGGLGIVIQQNQSVSPASVASSSPGALEQLQQAVGDLLFHKTRTQTDPGVIEPPAKPPRPSRRWQDPVDPADDDVDDAPDDEIDDTDETDETDDDTDETDDTADTDDDEGGEEPTG